MKLFTIDTRNDESALGAEFVQFEVVPGVKIPAIAIGEEGRNRKLGILPVEPNLVENKKVLAHCTGTMLGDGTIIAPKIKNGQVIGNAGLFGDFVRFEKTVKPDSCWRICHPEFANDQNIWHGYIFYIQELSWKQAVRPERVGIGQTQSGRPKLVALQEENAGCIIVIRSCIPKRKHDKVPLFGETQDSAFPGEILLTGEIADGMAGYVGSATQRVVAIKQPCLFHIQNLHLQKWRWDGQELVEVTKSEAYL